VVDPSRTDRAPAADRSRRHWRSTVTTGTIKKVVSDRGFGFITAEDGKDYFFHRDGLTASIDFDRLNGGEKVTFDVESGPKGDRAKNVQTA
jgi:CspA family cold shock protein